MAKKKTQKLKVFLEDGDAWVVWDDGVLVHRRSGESLRLEDLIDAWDDPAYQESLLSFKAPAPAVKKHVFVPLMGGTADPALVEKYRDLEHKLRANMKPSFGFYPLKDQL